MPLSHDEFGDSLDDMFPNLRDESDMPELEQLTDFGQGATFRQTPPAYTETHLVCLFTLHDCAVCHSRTRVSAGYAVRRFHRSRNACIEYQTILPEMYKFFDHLPKVFKDYHQTDPFCLTCATQAGFHLDADSL